MTDYSWLLDRDMDWLANVPQEELNKLLEGTGETVNCEDAYYHPLTWDPDDDSPPEAA